MNLKPVEQMPNDLQLLNPDEWAKKKDKYVKKQRKKGDKRPEIEILTEMEEEMEKGEQYKLDKSAGSCKVNNILGIIYGGISSRFWLLRKHINSLDWKQLKDLPFHSWDCITLQLSHRDVDLVITNEQHMSTFIKFLVYRMKTLDGNRGSAIRALEAMNKQAIKDFLTQRRGRATVPESRQHQIMATNEFKVFRKVCLKYAIMRIRAKISYEAMMQQKTVCELFLGVIYKHFRQSSTDDSRKEQIDELWNSVLRGEPGFLKKVVLNANADNSDDPELRNQMEMIKK